jgi:hypothetical protein
MKGIVTFLLLAQSIVTAAAERPQDFAYGVAIHADAQEALYEIELPAAVYRGVTRSDLGDLRIFNGQEEAVPYAFKPRIASAGAKAAAIELPRFPLYGETDDKLENLHIGVEKSADGTIVSILSSGKNATGRQQLHGYLLDASALKRPAQALLFDWQTGADGFAGKVRIEGGDDLAHWNRVADGAALVSMEFGGQRLQQKRVELRAEKYRYLRVSWPQNQRPLELLSVRAEPAADTVEAQRVRQAFPGKPVAGKPGEYEYDLGGYFPFDRLRIELPQVNTLVQAQVLARAKSATDWRPVTTAVTYRLRHDGAEITSPEVALASNSERYWLLRVDQKGGGVGAGLPVLHIGWVPQKLVFAARGAGPFQLAYGNSVAKAASFPIESIIPGYKTDSEFKLMSAALGEQVTLAGSARLRAPVDYKTWALWASLVLGVSLLGGMAYRLSRQMAKPPPESVAESRTMDKPK